MSRNGTDEFTDADPALVDRYLQAQKVHTGPADTEAGDAPDDAATD